MGACCSCQMGSGFSQHHGMVKGSAMHDSAWSVANKQHAANGTAPAGATEQQQHQQQSKQQRKQQHSKQQVTAPKKKAKRMPNTDLATGELIPDFGVHGVFDVLYELGSGGSGRTYLCRWGHCRHCSRHHNRHCSRQLRCSLGSSGAAQPCMRRSTQLQLAGQLHQSAVCVNTAATPGTLQHGQALGVYFAVQIPAAWSRERLYVWLCVCKCVTTQLVPSCLQMTQTA